jgi:tRNA threonylcarbamoyl adenosine modification protein (Sua5/YciO/YrdC/YwlC family)
MLIRIYPKNPDEKQIDKVVEMLRDGAVIVYPTDGVYAFGCDVYKAKAVERIAQLKGIKPEKADFSFVFNDLSKLSEFTRGVNTSTFKLLKKNLPGPFTFILNANNAVPKIFKNNKKTLGIRIPDNDIINLIVERLGNPIIASSVHDEDEIIEYTTDPELIHERYEKQVDLVIDGGYGQINPSTVVDCTHDDFEIIRQGSGELFY